MKNNQENFFSLSVQDIMSKSPKTINQMARLTDAGEMMRNYNIHSLVVVNDSNEFVGIIDAFACL